MAIPSYDDLTPSIPDVKPDEVFSGLGVRGSGLGRPGSQDPGPTSKKNAAPAAFSESRAPSPEPRSSDPGELYAALHEADGAAIDRLMTIARDFSPRIERRPGGTVVLDVSGLQRLF